MNIKTIEEKAKAYDEALKWMRELYPGLHGATKEDAEHYFPELRESEDERIRQGIVETIKQCTDMLDPKNQKRMLAYLEKQKEPLPIPDKFSGLKSLMLQYLQSAANRKDDSEIESDTDLWGRKILDYVWKYDDRQKEQKPRWEINNPHTTKWTREMIDEKFEELVEPKPAWSEEDEAMIKNILFVLESYVSHSESASSPSLVTSYPTYYKEIDWLKSLRPQPHWKPSEEQIEALNYAIAEWDGGKKLEGLYALRTDLKKLM